MEFLTATSAFTVKWIVNPMSGPGEIRPDKMLAEYGIYCDYKIIGLICDDPFFVMRTRAGYAFWSELSIH